jgi:hypothetical protein
VRSDNEIETPELMGASYRGEMRRLLDAIDSIPAGLRSAPIHGDWTIREVMAHLAGWDRAIAASADDVLAGRPARLTAMRLEDVNDELVDAWRARPLDEVRRDMAEAHQALLDRVDGQSVERWRTAAPGQRWRDGSPMTLASVFAYRFRGRTHYGGHAEEIEEWLASAGPGAGG